MTVIALVGFAGSGKDTAAQVLVDNDFHPFSFAEALKDALASIFCWPRELLEGKTKESRVWRETVDPWWSAKLELPGFTPRYAMQNFGTDVMRRHFHPDLWVLNVEKRMHELGPGANVVLVDGRFPNELDMCRRNNGLVVRVKRGDDPEWFEAARLVNLGELTTSAMEFLGNYKVHHSEWAWIGQPIDVVVENDGTVDDLQGKVFDVCVRGNRSTHNSVHERPGVPAGYPHER